MTAILKKSLGLRPRFKSSPIQREKAALRLIVWHALADAQAAGVDLDNVEISRRSGVELFRLIGFLGHARKDGRLVMEGGRRVLVRLPDRPCPPMPELLPRDTIHGRAVADDPRPQDADRRCLGCGKMRRSEWAGDRYHPECKAARAAYRHLEGVPS